MRYLSILGALILAGCVHKPQSDFDRAESFVKPISTGLYFLREVDSGGLWENKESTSVEWDKSALAICPSGYKVLLLNDDALSYQGLSFSYMGSFVMASPGTKNLPVIDGVVLCNSSPISEKDARQVLVDEYYIVPQKN